MPSRVVPIFLFTHNDESTIETSLLALERALASQQEPLDAGTSWVIHVLANGCRDGTATVARAFADSRAERTRYHVHELELGDKGDAWNYGVHQVLPTHPEASVALFVDSDIDLSETNIWRLVGYLDEHSDALATVSEARKRPYRFSMFSPAAFVLSRSGQDHIDGKICGQLYALRTDTARRVWLPRGLLVEDGLLAGCVATELFSHQPRLNLIHAHRAVCHYFEAERTLASAIRHEARLELGTHINMVGCPILWEQGSAAESFLRESYASNPDWLVERFHASFAARGVGAFRWERALAPLRGLRLRARLPLDLVLAALRTVQRGAALIRAYQEAKSRRLRW